MVASVASDGWLSCLAWLVELPRMVIGLRCDRLAGVRADVDGVEERGDDGVWVPARVALSAHGFVSGKSRANDGVWVPARVALSAHGFVSGKSRANDGVGRPPGSRCRLVVFPGETAAVESLFWAERTGLYVALATQTPVLPRRIGKYRLVRSPSHAAAGSIYNARRQPKPRGTQLLRRRALPPRPHLHAPAPADPQRKPITIRGNSRNHPRQLNQPSEATQPTIRGNSRNHARQLKEPCEATQPTIRGNSTN
jgi:hypothetical protein